MTFKLKDECLSLAFQWYLAYLSWCKYVCLTPFDSYIPTGTRSLTRIGDSQDRHSKEMFLICQASAGNEMTASFCKYKVE